VGPEFELGKWISTERDFEQMGWHDCHIHAIQFGEAICFDIDYILKWNSPDRDGLPFTFWVAPATLCFDKPGNATLEVETSSWESCSGLEISDIHKETGNQERIRWRVETQQGDIGLEADKYVQVIRRPPTLQFGQAIDLIERGSVSFSLNPNETFVQDECVAERRAKDLEHYQLVLQRYDLLEEQRSLVQNQLGLKKFLLVRRSLQSRIDDLSEQLRNTRFENWIGKP